MYETGKLNQRITFYKQKSGLSPNKLVEISDMEVLRTCWANLLQVGIRDEMKMGIEIQDQIFTIKCRLFHGLNTSDCRVFFNNSWYYIQTIEIDKPRQELTVSVAYDARLSKNSGVTT